MSSTLIDLLNQPRRPRVLVIGDVMLDRYVWGDVDRISPEAPIPVLKVFRQEERLGGAGSVVTMLAALETEVIAAGVTADDPQGEAVRRLLGQQPGVTDRTLVAAGRTTTVKERLLGRTQSRHPQQMVRVDTENSEPIADQLAGRLLAEAERCLDQVDLVLISDYNKGVCGGRLVAELAARARRCGVSVVADPAGNVDYGRYAGCTGITPNRTETSVALGCKIATCEQGLEAARRLLRFDVQSAVVTLDRDGIAWASADGQSRLFPARPRQVYDITGAGDMVLAALGYALACGADWPSAVELANLAGGLEVERLGVTPLTRWELLGELSRRGFSAQTKIVSVDQLQEQLRRRRQAGQRIVMTNGCFDLLHPGHVASLQYARSQGECLVVGLNSDRSVRQIKGPGRPVIDQQGRAEMLAALECVDYVVLFEEASVDRLVERVGPDVLVKADQYTPQQVVGHQIVERRGGKVVLAPMKGKYSSTGMIGKIRGTAPHDQLAEQNNPPREADAAEP